MTTATITEDYEATDLTKNTTNQYNDLKDINDTFTKGTFIFKDFFTVGGIKYHLRGSPDQQMIDMIKKNYKSIVVYTTTDRDKLKNSELKEWIIFLWGFPKNSRPGSKLIPYEARTDTMARIEGRDITEAGNVAEKPDPNKIGHQINVQVTNIPGSHTLKAKVDTGADICSLHADKWKIDQANNTINFVAPDLSRNVITKDLADQQAVKSADGGVDYRPVIELNLRINDKLITNVKVNLNNRTHMEHPMLIGKNALKQGHFLIDPNIDESFNFDDYELTTFQKSIENIEPPATQELDESIINEIVSELKQDVYTRIYNTMNKSGISISDLIEYKTE